MNIFKTSLIVMFMFVFLGCATNRYTYNKSIPDDRQCVLIIPEDFTVVKFDEDTVNWKVGYNIIYSMIDSISQKKREAFVNIPEGEHTLTINYLSVTTRPSGYNSYNLITRSAEGIKVTSDFQHGNTYSLVPVIMGDKITVIVRRH